MRKLLVGLLFLTMLTTAASLAAEEYRIVLKDGSWLRAREKPVVEDGQARVRLVGGHLTLVAADRIDWDASEEWNRATSTLTPRAGAATVLPGTGRGQTGTITMIGDGSGDADEAQEVIEAADQRGDASESPTLQEIRSMEAEIRLLEQQKSEIEGQATNNLNLDTAANLRQRAAELDQRIRDLRSRQNGLVRELDAAERQGSAPEPGEDVDQSLRDRIRFLEREIQFVREQKTQLEQQAANEVRLETADRLRQQAADLGQRIDTLRAEQNGLILQLSGRNR